MGANFSRGLRTWATNCEVWAEADPGFMVAILQAGARLMLLPLGSRPSSRSRRRAYRSYPTVDRSTRLAGAVVPRRPCTMIEAETAADVLARAPTCTGHLYPTLVPQRYRQPRGFSPRLQARPPAYVVPAARLLCAGATPRYPAVAREFRLVLRSRNYAADIGQSSLKILSEAEGAELSVPRCILQPQPTERSASAMAAV